MPASLLLLLSPAALAQSLIHETAGVFSGDSFGSAVAGAGDVDGDGRADWIVGAPSVAAPAGYAAVYSGLSGARLHLLLGASSVDGFGAAVAGVGDLDGDGCGDLLVGAPYEDVGAAFDAGLATLYSGRTGAPIARFGGSASSEQFGSRVGGLPDLDGDLVPDFAIAGSGASFRGSLTLYSGASLAPIRTLVGDAAFDSFGAAFASPGDVDGDGTADLLIGAPFSDVGAGDAGSAYLHSGRDGARLLSLHGSSFEEGFGHAVAGHLGDLDGDAVPDLAVGAPGNDSARANAGLVRIHSGASGILLISIAGEDREEQLGGSLAALADADGDGRPDLALGSSFSLTTSDGRVLVWSSAQGGISASFFSAESNSIFAGSLADGGDLDGDGRSELLVGAPGSDLVQPDAGCAFAYSLRGLTLAPLAPGLAGQINATTVGGAAPFASVYVVSSLQGGRTAVPGCAGLIVDQANPSAQGPALADAAGVASFSGFVPPGLSGRTLLLQAAVPADCAISPPLATFFP